MNTHPTSYDTVGKSLYHADIVSFLRNTREHGARLWNEDKTKLAVKVVDLAGPDADKTIECFVEREKIVSDNGLVFVDHDESIIQKFAPQYPAFTWIHENLFDLLHDQKLEDVGVLLVDGFSEVGDDAIASQLPNIHALIRRGIEARGAFVLAINCVVDTVVRRKRTRAAALREWTETLARGLSGYLPRRKLDADHLLPHGIAEVLDEDHDFVGSLAGTSADGVPLGSFFVSRSHVQRMANFRILLVQVKLLARADPKDRIFLRRPRLRMFLENLARLIRSQRSCEFEPHGMGHDNLKNETMISAYKRALRIEITRVLWRRCLVVVA